MQKSTLHDLAKFGAGLILGDFLFGLWFYSSGYLPLNFMGISFNERTRERLQVYGYIPVTDINVFTINRNCRSAKRG